MRVSSLKGFVTLLSLAVIGCEGREDDRTAEAMRECAAAETNEACLASGGAEFRCAWVRSVVVTGDCETADELRCVAYVDTPGPPACLPIRGCQGDGEAPERLIAPAFREEAPGVTRLVNGCTAEPLGYDACEAGDPDGAAHPACACVCAPPP